MTALHVAPTRADGARPHCTSCDGARYAAQLFIDHTLPATGRAALGAHLARCPQCRAQLRADEALARVLRRYAGRTCRRERAPATLQVHVRALAARWAAARE